jgi:hypothetical protein
MTNSYDNETLYEYLLGSLPDEDIERLDELTFTDPIFAESVDSAEKDLVDSYVSGSLSGSMLERFESHYLASPVRRKNVQFARTFQQFAEKEVVTEPGLNADVAVASGVRPKGKTTGFFESLAAWSGGGVFQFAAAAVALVLLGLGGWLLIRGLNARTGGDEIASTANNSPIDTVNSVSVQITPTPAVIASPGNNIGSNEKPEISSSPIVPKPTSKSSVTESSQPVIATVILLPPLRGGQKLSQVSITPETKAADFTLNLESGDYASYKVELTDQDSGRSVWHASPVKPHEKRGSSSLGIRIPARLLQPKIYSFAISGIAKDGTTENIGDYAFRVVR